MEGSWKVGRKVRRSYLWRSSFTIRSYLRVYSFSIRSYPTGIRSAFVRGEEVFVQYSFVLKGVFVQYSFVFRRYSFTIRSLSGGIREGRKVGR